MDQLQSISELPEEDKAAVFPFSVDWPGDYPISFILLVCTTKPHTLLCWSIKFAPDTLGT